MLFYIKLNYRKVGCFLFSLNRKKTKIEQNHMKLKTDNPKTFNSIYIFIHYMGQFQLRLQVSKWLVQKKKSEYR